MSGTFRAAIHRPAARRAWLALLAALAVLGTVLAPDLLWAAYDGAPRPGSASAAPAGAPEQARAADALTLTLDDLSPAFATPSDTLTLSGTVTNGTTETITDPVLTIGVQRAVPLTPAGLLGWFDADLPPRAREEYRAAQPLVVEPGATVSFTAQVPMADLDFPIRYDNWGARGLEISLEAPNTTASTRTVGVFVPDDGVPSEPIHVAVLAPATPSAAEWRAMLGTGIWGPDASTARRVRDLTALAGLSVALDPSVAAVGATRSVIALPWADADVAVLGVARPDGVALLDEARTLSAQAFATYPVAASAGIAWPLAPGVTPDLLSTLAAIGYDAVVLEPGALLEEDRAAPGATPPDAGEELAVPTGTTRPARARVTLGEDPEASDGPGIEALVADPAFSALLVGTLPTGASATGADPELTARQLTLALSAVAARTNDAEAGLLGVLERRSADALDASTTAALGDRLSALDTAPWVTLMDATTLLAEPTEQSLRPSDLTQTSALTPELAEVVSGVVAEEALVEALSSAVDEDDRTLTDATAALRIAASTAWRASGSTGAGVVGNVSATLAELTAGIHVSPPESQVNLFAEASAVPIVVTSTLDVPMTLHVRLEPDYPSVRVEGIPDVTIGAHESQTIRIPVTALANGRTPVQVTVTTPSGTPLGPPTTFTMVVRAEWEGVTTAVVAAALAVLLIFGLVRTIRRGRRRSDEDPDGPGASGASGASGTLGEPDVEDAGGARGGAASERGGGGLDVRGRDQTDHPAGQGIESIGETDEKEVGR